MEKIILFDVGKTLVDSESIVRTAVEYTSKKLKELELIEDKEKFIRGYLEADKETTFEHVNHTYSDFKIIKKAWRNLGKEDNYKAYAYFFFYYRDQVRCNIKFNQKISELFQKLRDKGIILGIVSDGTIVETLETFIRLGIIPYLESNLIFISEDIGTEKVGKSFYEYVLQRIGDDSKEVIIVGDRLKADIIVPKQFGFKTVLVLKYAECTGDEIRSANPDFVINDIFGVERVLDIL